jgi:hypothetical protein
LIVLRHQSNLILRYTLLNTTFDVLVGLGPLQNRFTLHTEVFTKRSEFFRAARSPEWLVDPSKPVDLTDYDQEVFSAYMNCAYFGAKIIRGEQWPPKESYKMPEDEKLEDAFDLSQEECEKRVPASHGDYLSLYTSHCMEYLRTLAKVYLQADRLQDFATANLVIDEIIDTQERTNHSSPNDVINTVYESTVHGSPLRKLMRDVGLHGGWSAFYLDPHSFKFHEDYARDIFVEFMRVKNSGWSELVQDVYGIPVESKREADRCFYHIHGLHHPACVPDPELLDEGDSEPPTDDESESD